MHFGVEPLEHACFGRKGCIECLGKVELGETLQSQGSGNRAWNDEEKGHKKRKQTYKCKPLPEDLVLTELTDSGPVKKENFVKRAVAAKFSDESSEGDEDEDEEHGEVRKKRRW